MRTEPHLGAYRAHLGCCWHHDVCAHPHTRMLTECVHTHVHSHTHTHTSVHTLTHSRFTSRGRFGEDREPPFLNLSNEETLGPGQTSGLQRRAPASCPCRAWEPTELGPHPTTWETGCTPSASRAACFPGTPPLPTSALPREAANSDVNGIGKQEWTREIQRLGRQRPGRRYIHPRNVKWFQPNPAPSFWCSEGSRVSLARGQAWAVAPADPKPRPGRELGTCWWVCSKHISQEIRKGREAPPPTPSCGGVGLPPWWLRLRAVLQHRPGLLSVATAPCAQAADAAAGLLEPARAWASAGQVCSPHRGQRDSRGCPRSAALQVHREPSNGTALSPQHSGGPGGPC